jgi:hypothetical protein
LLLFDAGPVKGTQKQDFRENYHSKGTNYFYDLKVKWKTKKNGILEVCTTEVIVDVSELRDEKFGRPKTPYLPPLV